MLKVEIKSAEVSERSGISEKTGKPYTIREQTGYAFIEGEAYPVKIKLPLDRDQQPFGKGYYQLAGSCFYVSKYGRLELSKTLVLRPIQVQQAA